MNNTFNLSSLLVQRVKKQNQAKKVIIFIFIKDLVWKYQTHFDMLQLKLL